MGLPAVRIAAIAASTTDDVSREEYGPLVMGTAIADKFATRRWGTLYLGDVSTMAWRALAMGAVQSMSLNAVISELVRTLSRFFADMVFVVAI